MPTFSSFSSFFLFFDFDRVDDDFVDGLLALELVGNFFDPIVIAGGLLDGLDIDFLCWVGHLISPSIIS
jgi:hypothetical protein